MTFSILVAGGGSPTLGLGPSGPFLAALVGLCYAIQTATAVLIVVQGFRRRSYGMPVVGIVTMLGIDFIVGFVGPMLEPHLFRRVIEVPALLWLWRLWTALMAIMLVQYLVYAREHPRFWPALARYTVPITLAALAVVGYGEWAFLVFYQDVYVNEICPICMLVMALAYLATLFTRARLRGLSIAVACGWGIANILIYGAVVFGNMAVQYPCHDGTCALLCDDAMKPVTCDLPGACPEQPCTLQLTTGYGFIYWIYGLTIAANLVYAVGLIRRREELGDDWDVRRTIARMTPRVAGARADA